MGIAQELADLGTKIVVFDVQKDYIHWPDELSFKRNRHFKSIRDDDVLFIDIEKSHDFLKDEGVAGDVIYTPGHSDDSISVILDSGIAIVRDLPPYPQIEAYGDPVIAESWEKLIRHGAKHACHAHCPKYDIS